MTKNDYAQIIADIKEMDKPKESKKPVKIETAEEYTERRLRESRNKLEIEELRTETMKQQLLQIEIERIKQSGGSIRDLQPRQEPIDLTTVKKELQAEIEAVYAEKDAIRQEAYEQGRIDAQSLFDEVPEREASPLEEYTQALMVNALQAKTGIAGGQSSSTVAKSVASSPHPSPPKPSEGVHNDKQPNRGTQGTPNKSS